jgi:small subunit ribosomal protein S6
LAWEDVFSHKKRQPDNNIIYLDIKIPKRSDALAQNVYEGLFILDPNRYGHDPDGVSGQLPALIVKLGGEILVSRLWEERRLAYPVKGHRKGTYWLIYFRLEGDQLSELKKQCLINENLLRGLFLKVDPRIVDALVEHARTAPVVTISEETEAPPVADKKVIAGVELEADELNVEIDAVDADIEEE